jgi:hypothetical protein
MAQYPFNKKSQFDVSNTIITSIQTSGSQSVYEKVVVSGIIMFKPLYIKKKKVVEKFEYGSTTTDSSILIPITSEVIIAYYFIVFLIVLTLLFFILFLICRQSNIKTQKR